MRLDQKVRSYYPQALPTLSMDFIYYPNGTRNVNPEL